jgi:uncharacterized protein (DUF2141 family)
MRLPLHPLAPINLAKIALSSGWLILMDAGVVAGQLPACPGIHVTILGIRNSVGTVDCALFDAPKGFPVDVLRSAMRLVAMKVPSSEARPQTAQVLLWFKRSRKAPVLGNFPRG